MRGSSNKYDVNKLSGFDILDRLPEEQMLRSYNEEFYTSMNVKITTLPLLNDYDKLFYHFEQNDNASVTTNIGQLLVRNN